MAMMKNIHRSCPEMYNVIDFTTISGIAAAAEIAGVERGKSIRDSCFLSTCVVAQHSNIAIDAATRHSLSSKRSRT